jgi:DnaJ-class molecular chaperone
MGRESDTHTQDKVVLMPSGDGKGGENGQHQTLAGSEHSGPTLAPEAPEGLPFQCPRCHGTGWKHMKRGQKLRRCCPYCAGIGWIKYKGTAYDRWRGAKKR